MARESRAASPTQAKPVIRVCSEPKRWARDAVVCILLNGCMWALTAEQQSIAAVFSCTNLWMVPELA